jgi:hypothetical protein
MFARILGIPLVIIALLFLYLTWEIDEAYSIYIIPPVVIGAIIYVLSPQLNWWWYTRHPPDLAPSLRALLERAPGFYHTLSPSGQLKFRQRTAMFIMGSDFMGQGMEAPPPDAQLVAAASAVTISWRQRQFLFPRYEHVVFYPHPFPTPQYPEQFHLSEVFDEDGVVLFSVPHLFKGFFEPEHYFPIGLYEYAQVFMRSKPEASFPEIHEENAGQLEEISGVSLAKVAEWLGLDDINARAVAIAYFFIFPEKMAALWPDVYRQIESGLQTATLD